MDGYTPCPSCGALGSEEDHLTDIDGVCPDCYENLDRVDKAIEHANQCIAAAGNREEAIWSMTPGDYIEFPSDCIPIWSDDYASISINQHGLLHLDDYGESLPYTPEQQSQTKLIWQKLENLRTETENPDYA